MGSPVRVKVCGIRRLEDVETALNLGAEFIGVNVYADSPRSVTIGEACELVESIPKGKRVLVDVTPAPEQLEEYRAVGFDYFQIHFGLNMPLATLASWSAIVGKEKLWLAPRIPPEEAFPESVLDFSDTILSDTYSEDAIGGTGKTHNWHEFHALQDIFPERKWILAGGLHPDNIARAVKESGARYVDVNSGVESAPGEKDREKLARLFKVLGK